MGILVTYDEIVKKAKLELLDELENICPHCEILSANYKWTDWVKGACAICRKQIREELEGK